MRFNMLYPEHRSVEVPELLAELSLTPPKSLDRPYVIANFVASADGHASFDGKSGALGDDGDHAIFHGLREQVDVVLAGTGTLETEHYGRLVRDPERAARRVARGLPATPPLAVITRSGTLPPGIPLLDDPDSTVIVLSPEPVERVAAARVEPIELRPDELTPTQALRRLRADYGIRSVLCEGGPTLFGALIQDGAVDELFLTLAPKLAGAGTAPSITAGPQLPAPAELRLAWVLERSGALFLRYVLRGSR